MVSTKRCSTCKQDKFIEGFTTAKKSPDGIAYSCNDCKNAWMRGWRKRNPDIVRDRNLRRAFGIGAVEYDAMLSEQDGVCLLCGLVCPSGNRLGVDHAHDTDKIRGLLCNKCNTAVERIDNVPGWGLKAHAYVESKK